MPRFAYWQVAVFVAVILALFVQPWQYKGYLADQLGYKKALKVPRCEERGLRTRHEPRNKVFDLALVDNELDFLEIRLHTLNETVDHFVFVESNTTFTGIPKPLYLQENWDRFKDFHHKIIHHIVNDQIDSAWSHEFFARNQLLKAAMDGNPQNGDMIIVSDLDEIPRPEIIAMLRNCEYPTRVTLWTGFFNYAYQWKNVGREWDHPQVTEYRGEDTVQPESLRAFPQDMDMFDIYDAGWHCSSCFKTLKQVLHKLEGFSHADSFNTADNRDPRHIIDRYQHGLDLYGRKEEQWKAYPVDDLPEYVKKNSRRFQYLLDRTGETAAFEDAEEYLKPTEE